MQFTVNETPSGIVAPDKNKCKVKDCPHNRMKSNRPYPFCKKHSGLRTQVSKQKFKELAGNNELVILTETPGKKKGVTSKVKKFRLLRKQVCG
jgi:hypothetical protein